MDLQSSFRSYDKSVKKINPTYSGLLGLTIDGLQRVEHPTRNGFVYFRFRDNLSETALAFNDKVSPVYDLPVRVERRGNNWYVIGRDDARYSNWGSSAPFLPKHGFQHSFDRDAGTGGDVVFIYPDQFVPLLVYPSGTEGANNVLVAPYVLQRTSDFLYVGNTGTRNLLIYKPTGTSAIMGLVYLDRNTGNPGILVNSGTSFSASLTGTPDIAQYIPYPSSTQEPLYAFRLVSGTETIQWSNLYNVRQFIGGSTASGSSIGTLTAQRVVITDSGGTVTTDPELYYDNSNNIMIIGDSSTSPTLSPNSFQMVNDGVSPAIILASYGSGTAPFITGFKTDGSAASPTNVKDEQVLFRVRARGHDGIDFTNTQGEIRYVAEGNWDAGSHPIKIEYYATPTGSTTLTRVAGMHGDKSFWFVNSLSGTVGRPDSGETAVGVDSFTKMLYSIDDTGRRTDYTPTGSYSLTVLELDSSPTVNNVNRIIFDGTTVSNLGFGSILVTPKISIQDEGVSQGTVTTLNFVGNNVDVSVSGTVGRVFVTGTCCDVGGWISDSNTWSFLSADSPSFVVSVNSNVTGTIGVGMKTQLGHLSQTKNFFVTNISVTGSTSYLNLYGGTDYSLTTGSITNPKYSMEKSPFGFSIDPAKWTVETSTTSECSKTNPTASVWYGGSELSATGPSLSIPIGAWRVEYFVNAYGADNAAPLNCFVTLSTANNTESDIDFTSFLAVFLPSASASNTVYAPTTKAKFLNLNSKTTYYANVMTSNTQDSIGINGSIAKAFIRAICAYL